jgi:hypothetical protein
MKQLLRDMALSLRTAVNDHDGLDIAGQKRSEAGQAMLHPIPESLSLHMGRESFCQEIHLEPREAW